MIEPHVSTVDFVALAFQCPRAQQAAPPSATANLQNPNDAPGGRGLSTSQLPLGCSVLIHVVYRYLHLQYTASESTAATRNSGNGRDPCGPSGVLQ